MKNKNLYSICFCMALAGSLQTTYGQVDAEGVADSTLSAAGGETDSLQIVVQREMNKIPTVVYKGALVDAATGGRYRAASYKWPETTGSVPFPTNRVPLK